MPPARHALVPGVESLPHGRRAFRPEVQALRAVAVAGVVLYHLWPRSLPGGFVGVDVFFVISGFLITQHLAEEISRTGRVSLARFWARRIRRILPAALTVLAACIGIVVLVMPRLTWQANLSEIRAAAAYFENWLLGAHAVDYLAAENTPSLVQHYWSLSVEEQFYLLWPLLLLVGVVAARRVRRARVEAWLVLVLAVAAVASFVVSIIWTDADRAMAFFATPTRAWEFAVGGLVGTGGVRAAARLSANARAVVSYAGLTLITYSVFAITSNDAFPGWIAVIPVAGAALFIVAESSAVPWSPDRAVAAPAVQWVGDNSYSIYLWHWPLIVAAPWVTHGPTSWAGKLVILAASLVLAALTKRVVEDPIRSGRMWHARNWPAYAFATAGVAALVALSSGFADNVQRIDRAAGAQARAASTALVVSHKHSCFGAAAMMPENQCRRPYARPRHLDTAFAASDGRNDPCLQNYDAATPRLCTVGDTKTPRLTIALVGNSHAWRLIPAFDLYGAHHHWRIIVATRINCLGLITSALGPNGASANCLRWSAAVQQRLLSMRHLDAVVFAGYRYADEFVEGSRPSPASLRAAQKAVLATWAKYDARGIRVVVTGDVPGMRPAVGPECIAQSSARYDPCAISRASIVRPDLTSSLARARPDLAAYVSLTRYFCDDTKCHALIGGVVVYFDSHHVTATYSRSLARYLGADVAAALQRRP